MKKQEFLNLVIESADLEERITPESDTTGMDSLTSMIIQGLISEHFNVFLSAPSIRTCDTYDEILKLTGYVFE